MIKRAAREIPSLLDDSKVLIDWLRPRAPEHTPTFENMYSFRWVVEQVNYETMAREYWESKWFQKGIVAFTIFALESENVLEVLEDKDAKLWISIRQNGVFSIDKFVAGEAILYLKQDPEYSDLCWDVVPAMGHILKEFS